MGLCQLKETAALQKLSYFLYKKDRDNSKRATQYIQHTMEDAQFFNNRLRMIEISNILPVIVTTNQEAAERSRTRLWSSLDLSVPASSLTIILILTVVNNQTEEQFEEKPKEIAAQNRSRMNGRAHRMNQH